MSVEAISWVLNHAPVENPTSKLVLIALANHARPDGSAAFPSVGTIERYTCLSERAIRQHLASLEESGIIERCDPAIVAAHIPRSDRRPTGWNLRIGVQQVQVAAERGASRAATGCTSFLDGVQEVPDRGAGGAPKPYIEPSIEPSIETESEPKALTASQYRNDAIRLCNLLADLMVENGCKRPAITSTWIGDMDKIMRLDGRTPDQVEAAIRWSQASEFWSANIHSPGKLRAKYDTLRLQARRQYAQTQPRGFDGIQQFLDDEAVRR